MARRKSARTSSRTTKRTTTSNGRSRGGLAKYLLPAAALGIATYLLWPKKALAGQQPQIGPVPPAPMPLPGSTSTLQIDPVANATLTDGTSLGIINANDVLVRSGPSETSAKLARLPLGAGVAVPIGAPLPATAAAPKGWQPVTTARGVKGYVAAQYVDVSGFTSAAATPTPATAGWYAGVDPRTGRAIKITGRPRNAPLQGQDALRIYQAQLQAQAQQREALRQLDARLRGGARASVHQR